MTDSLAHQHAKPFVHMTATTKALYFSITEIQSRMDIRQPDSLNLEYTRTMMGFLLFCPEPASIAMIGLGGGSLAKFCYRNLPTTEIRAIEINPHVIALRDEFQVPPDSQRFSVIQGDGAEFVRHPPRLFDVLLVDGYDHCGLPGGLSSQSFYDACFDMLQPDGILAANLHFDLQHYVQRVERIRRSFNDAILVVNDNTRSNSIVFARKGLHPGSIRVGPLRRPRILDEAAWRSLQGALSRILSALKRERQ